MSNLRLQPQSASDGLGGRIWDRGLQRPRRSKKNSKSAKSGNKKLFRFYTFGSFLTAISFAIAVLQVGPKLSWTKCGGSEQCVILESGLFIEVARECQAISRPSLYFNEEESLTQQVFNPFYDDKRKFRTGFNRFILMTEAMLSPFSWRKKRVLYRFWPKQCWVKISIIKGDAPPEIFVNRDNVCKDERLKG